eukprot:Opistho-2@59644
MLESCFNEKAIANRKTTFGDKDFSSRLIKEMESFFRKSFYYPLLMNFERKCRRCFFIALCVLLANRLLTEDFLFHCPEQFVACVVCCVHGIRMCLKYRSRTKKKKKKKKKKYSALI